MTGAAPGERLMLGIAVADAQAAHDALVAADVAMIAGLKDNPWATAPSPCATRMGSGVGLSNHRIAASTKAWDFRLWFATPDMCCLGKVFAP